MVKPMLVFSDLHSMYAVMVSVAKKVIVFSEVQEGVVITLDGAQTGSWIMVRRNSYVCCSSLLAFNQFHLVVSLTTLC